MKWIVFSLLVAIVASDTGSQKFDKFKQKFKKAYDKKNEALALHHFTKNQKMVDDHNARFAAGLESFDMDMYHFMDDDIQAHINATCGAKIPPQTRALPQTVQPDASSYAAGPASVNFTSSCLPVVDQGVSPMPHNICS